VIPRAFRVIDNDLLYHASVLRKAAGSLLPTSPLDQLMTRTRSITVSLT
jgi:hypothetical protein